MVKKFTPILVFVFSILTFATFNSNAQTNVVPDDIELEVLKNIYDSLGGVGMTNTTTANKWPDASAWPTTATSSQFGAWKGITISYGDISSISLSNCNLTGLIPKSIARLTRLRTLYLQKNAIGGSIPSSLGKLTLVTNLLLDHNALTGSIPSELGTMSSLLQLTLHNNLLTGLIPSTLGKLSSLDQLNVSYNQLTGAIPTTLGQLTLATYLYFSHNQLSGALPSFSALTNLKYFYASYNQFTEVVPASFASLKELLVFDIDNNHFSGSFPDVSLWTKVTEINVETNQLTGPVPEGITNCKALTVLYGDNNLLTTLPTGLLTLPVITSIDFHSNAIITIPDFSNQVNKANLILTLYKNKLDFNQIESFYNKGIKTIYYSPQNNIDDLLFAKTTSGGSITLTARSAGVNGTMNWERKVDGSSTWVNVNSLNADATQKTYQRANNQLADAGEYRYKQTNSLFSGMTIQSASIDFRVGNDQTWINVTGVQDASGVLSKTVADGWNNAGGRAKNTLFANTDGWFEFVLDQNSTTSNYMIGFSSINNNYAQTSIEFGVEVNTQNGLMLLAHESNVTGVNLGTASIGDVIRVGRDGSLIKYYKNGIEIRSVTGNASAYYITKAILNTGKTAPIVTSYAVLNETGEIPDALEQAALKDMYDSLGGNAWTNSPYWPMTGALPLTISPGSGAWIVNGDITRIMLQNCNLVGKIPSSISSLAKLQYLYVLTNSITGSIPPSMGSLTDLQYLYMDQNQFTGSIPTSFGNLTNLRVFHLGGQCTGSIPTQLNNLTNLTDLTIGGKFSGVITDLSNLKNITTLTIASTFFTPGPVPTWPASLPKINRILLNNCNLTGSIPEVLSTIQTLQVLDLSNNQLSGSIPPSLGKLSNLQWLYLYNNQLTGSIPASLGKLSNLLYLQLYTNQLSGSIPDSLGYATKLQTLSLNSNLLTGSIPASIGALNDLVTLQLSVNQLSGSIPSSLGNLRNLKDLHLSNNTLSGTIPASLGDLVSLNYLYLSGNQLSGEIPTSIGNLTLLRQLILNSNMLSGKVPASFSNLAGLTLLQLHVNQLSGDFPDIFTNMHYLTVCHLHDNQFTGAFPSSISNCTPLTLLNGRVNKFTSLPSSILTLPVLTSLVFSFCELTSIPDFSTHINKANLILQIQNNKLDYSQLEPLVNNGIKAITIYPQNDIIDIDFVSLIPGAALTIPARNPGQFSAITWEKLSGTTTWTSVNSLNADATQKTYVRTVAAASDAGTYRWRMTNSLVGGTIKSGSIIVETGMVADAVEFAALKDLYDSLGGLTWTNKVGWPLPGAWPTTATAAQMDGWNGIDIANGDISTLKMPSNNLTGKIPSSISKLEGVTFIDFNSNTIGGAIPASMTTMTGLTNLRLYGSQLTGSIPSNIGNLINLTELVLGKNNLTGTVPASIGSLQNLTWLSLYRNANLSGQLPDSFYSLKKLTDLYIYDTQISGQLSESIGGFTHLKNFWGYNNKWSGSLPAALGGIATLENLYLFNNGFTGSIPDNWRHLNGLKNLYLHFNQLSGNVPTWLGELIQMQILSIGDNPMEGTIPLSLSSLTNMTQLYMENMKLHGVIPDELNALNKLTLIDLKFCGLEGAIPAWLMNKPALKEFRLNDNKFTSFPDISSRTDKASLIINIQNNQIALPDIERYFSAPNIQPFNAFTYSPQRNYRLYSGLQLATLDELMIEGPVAGIHGVYTWEKLQAGDWTSLNSVNQSTDINIFKIKSISENDAGTYRYKASNTWVTDLSFESDAIEVIINDPIKKALDNWAFQYKYDGRKRMSAKKIPGADWVYMVYDNRDRMVMSQDGNQRSLSPRQWTFTKYDVFNRAILTGLYFDLEDKDQVSMQQKVNDFYGAIGTIGNENNWYEVRGTTVHGYTNKSFPLVNSLNDYFTVTYYDDYDFKSLINDPKFDYTNDVLPKTPTLVGQDDTENRLVKGQVTGTKSKLLSDNSWLWQVNYYDKKYKLIQTIAENHKGGHEIVTNIYDFIGKIIRTNTTNNILNEAEVSVTERFKYDHAERLLRTYHMVGKDPTQEILLSENVYNELGKLITKKLHSKDGTEFKQHVDYRYNIRGWLTRINNSDLNDADGGPKDFFGMDFGYNNDLNIGEYTPQYNGNISATKWSSNLGFSSLTKPNERAFKFTYDPLKRLLNATHVIKIENWSPSTSYSEMINYDLNGNISYLKRTDSDGRLADELFYNYGYDIQKSNQLLTIADGGIYNKIFKDGNPSGRDFWYDTNGNNVKDLNKDIVNTSFNSYLNLPQEVLKSNGDRIKTIYNSNGLKLIEETYTSGATVPSSRTDFIGRFIFQDGKLKTIQNDEGKVIMPESETSDPSPEYQYHLMDHLENIRLTFTTKDKVDEFKATMEDNGQPEITNPRVEELAYFGNLFETEIKNVNQWLNHTSNSGGNAIYLDGSDSKNIGPYSLLKVYPGDTVNMQAYGKFETKANYNTMSFVTMLASLATSVHTATIAATDAGAQLTTGEISDGLSPFVISKGSNTDRPDAYLNYVFFDKDFNVIDYKFDVIDESSGFEPAQEGTVNFDKMELSRVIDQQGFLYIYVSNESPGTRVWMDDLTITYKHSPITQYEDYYPFGLSMASTAFDRNNEGYNGMVTTEGLGRRDLGFRSYEPATGRFNAVDPLSELQIDNSPYQYSGNNPVLNRDVLGLNLLGDIFNFIRNLFSNKKRTHVETGYSLYHIRKPKDKKDNKKKTIKDTNTQYVASNDHAAEFARIIEATESQKKHVYGPSLENRRNANSIDNGHDDEIRDNSFSDQFTHEEVSQKPSGLTLVEAYKLARKEPTEKTREYLLSHLSVKDAMVCYYRAKWENSNDPIRKATDASTSDDDLGVVKDDGGSDYSLEKILARIKKANTPGSDNPTPGEMVHDPRTVDIVTDKDSEFSSETGDHNCKYSQPGASGVMDTKNPKVSVNENSIEISFNEKGSTKDLFKVKVSNTVSARAVLKKTGVDESKIDAIVDEIKQKIKDENASNDGADEKSKTIAALVNMCTSDEKYDKSDNTDDLKDIENETKVNLIKTLFDKDRSQLSKTYDGDVEQAVNNLIKGTNDEEIRDLHEKLQNEVVDTEENHGVKSSKLLPVIIKEESDYKPYRPVGDDQNYEHLVTILNDQFRKKTQLDPSIKPDNTENERTDILNWSGAHQKNPNPEDPNNPNEFLYKSVLGTDGKLTITRQVVTTIAVTTPTGTTMVPTYGPEEIYASYDKPLEDAITIIAEPGSEMEKLLGGGPLLTSAIWLHLCLDNEINGNIKFNINLGVNTAFFLLGAGYLTTAEGVTFYLGVVETSASLVNIELDIIEHDLVNKTDPETIKTIRLYATIFQLGSGVLSLYKSYPKFVAVLEPKATRVLDAVIDASKLSPKGKLQYLNAIETAKNVEHLKRFNTTADVVNIIKSNTSTDKKVGEFLDGISNQLKFADKEGTEISIFSSNVGETSEVAKVVKEGDKYVVKIVDSNILTKVDPQDVGKLTQDMVDNPALVQAMGKDSDLAKAWNVLDDAGVDNAVRQNPVRLGEIDNYLKKTPGTEEAIKQGLNDAGQYKEEFLNGIKNASEDLSHLNGRSALPNEISDAVVKIKQYRNSTANTSGGNYGYLEGSVNGNSVDNKMWRSVSLTDAEGEIHIFKAIEAAGSSGNSWLRTTDSEYRMLNKLASDLGGIKGHSFPNITGTLKIVSENPYCASCQGVIQQFNEMFPNVKLILVDGVK